MNVKEAAKVIGCDASHVRRMIRGGRLAATAYELPNGQCMYQISKPAARQAAERRKHERRGRPRKTNKE